MIDLSLLTPQWIVTQGQITLNTSSTKICDANPRRFCLVVCYLNNNSPPDAQENIAFLTIDSNPVQFGITLKTQTPYTFEFTKYPGLVGGEFWARDSGTNPTPNGLITLTEIVQTANP